MLGLLVGCADAGPRLQLQVPRSPRSTSALGAGSTSSVPANAQFDAPIIDPQTWNGTPVGTGSFSVALTPTASGGPSSVAFSDPSTTDRYVIIGDFTSASGDGLALISDSAWVVGANTLNGTTKTAVIFDSASGNVTAIARTGTVTLTAAGGALGQRVTGTLSASFVPYSSTPPGCVVDADCSSGEVCASGQCVRPTPPACTSHTQCPAGQLCNAGVCVSPQPQDAGPAPVCVTDRDCGAGQQCLAGQCVTALGCTSNAQCAVGEQCVAGQCIPTASGCTSNAQCPRGLVCQAGACVSVGPVSCTPKQGSGAYSGSYGSLTCSALGSGAVSLTSAGAAIDEDNGQLALFIVDPNTQRDGLVIELNACPAAAGATNNLSATLYSSQSTAQGVVLSAMIPGTATVTWTQVGATLAGSVSVSFVTGGTVSGTFTVQ
ncbi:MAG: hypothetical protein GQE15_02320 [Archangiaceae bacterium]|nr:hypothetical protein [Archangiaceae bacterium]